MIEVASRKKSFLGVLSVLCGEVLTGDVHMERPILKRALGQPGSRPEYRWFELKDATLEAGKILLEKKRMPVLYAYGQTGYGKPGYNMMNREWDFYYMVGAGIRWNIWDWNQNNRGRQVIEQQQLILLNSRASFDKQLESRLIQEEAKMEQHRKSMELEEQVLEIQKEISDHAAAKLANGTITATDYITELNKESMARINLASHQVQLMQAIANYLTIQGNL